MVVYYHWKGHEGEKLSFRGFSAVMKLKGDGFSLSHG
jgi:hypothetical protein